MDSDKPLTERQKRKLYYERVRRYERQKLERKGKKTVVCMVCEKRVPKKKSSPWYEQKTRFRGDQVQRMLAGGRRPMLCVGRVCNGCKERIDKRKALLEGKQC